MKRALVLLLAAVAIGIVILKVRARSHAGSDAAEAIRAPQPPAAASPAGQGPSPPATARAERSTAPAALLPVASRSARSVGSPARPVIARAEPAKAAVPASAPAGLLLVSRALAETPKPAPAERLSVPVPATSDAVAAALEQAAVLMKDGKYVEARALLNDLYLGSRGEQAARLRGVLDQANKELVFNPRCVRGAIVHIVEPGEVLITIARKYGVNWRMIRLVNGMTGDRLRSGQKLKVLPGPAGAVAYRSECRMALLLGGLYVKEYPIGIGKAGSETPTGVFTVDNMIEKPRWYKPEGGVVEYGKEGNLLGERWIGFANESGAAGLGIHGTNDEASVGTMCSNGCMRMRNADVIEVYDFLHPGSRVVVRD